MEFAEFPKIARLNRDVVITEKIDGTNACVFIEPVLESGFLARVGIADMIEHAGYFFAAGSRTRWITPERDNFGFARWAYDHKDELIAGLGVGRHFGEWWGSGIQRGYGLANGEKRFSLFNVARWHQHGTDPFVVQGADPRQPPKTSTEAPACCHVVPVLYHGPFTTPIVDGRLLDLREHGSVAAPGFMKPEGVVVFHTASSTLYKVTVEGDVYPKSLQKSA
jgi:hypothetical protein